MVPLGPLEMRVLGILTGNAFLAVGDVQAELRRSGEELAYTTVMTVLSRLHAKGVVSRHKEAKRYLYALAPAAPAVKEGIVARVHQALFQGNRLQPFVALLDDERISHEELRELRTLIDQRLKGKPR